MYKVDLNMVYNLLFSYPRDALTWHLLTIPLYFCYHITIMFFDREEVGRGIDI